MQKNTTRAFILGNGESRTWLEPEDLKEYGKVWMCNAAYRDHKPDALVAVDTRMIEEIVDSGYVATFEGETHFYPKEGQEGQHSLFRWGHSSGPWAALISLTHDHPDEVYLIGHDIYATDPRNWINNVYKGTENYVRVNHPQHDPHNWINELQRLFYNFPDVKFYHVSPVKKPAEWDKIPNLIYLTLTQLWFQLNSITS